MAPNHARRPKIAPAARRARSPAPAPPLAARPASARIVLAALGLAWLAMFLPQLLGARLFVIGDAPATRVFAEYSATRWHAGGVRTHWCPYVFAGLPTTSSLADSRPQYLPDALLTAFDTLHRLPFWPPLAIPLAVHLGGMVAAAWLARRLWGVGTAAMIWAGLAWGLMPNLVVPFTFGHDAQLMSISLIPVVLLALHHVFACEARAVAGASLALALALAAQLLAAYPQVVLLGGPIALVLAAERALTLRRAPRFAWAAGAAALAAALAAAVWWPALLYNQSSVRAGAAGGLGGQETAMFSLSLRDLAACVWPWAVGSGGGTYWGGMYQTDFPQYLGAAAVVLACVGATRREEPGRGIARVLGLAALAGMALSLGTHFGPLHALLSALVPLWSSFRLAVNHLVVAQLAVALLSARGLDAALRAAGPDARAPRLRPRLATPERVLLAVAAAMFAGAAWLASPAGSGLYQAAAAAARPALAGAAAAAVATRASGDLLLRGAVLGAIALALAASRRTAWARVPALVAAFALAAADLASVDVGFLRRASGTTASFAHPPPPAIATAGARDPLQRVLAVRRDLFWGNDWIRWRARSITGYHPAVPQAWADLYGARLMGLPPVLRALGVGYISGQAVMPDTASFEPWPGAPANDPVWRVRGALPRAYAARTVEALPDQRAVLGALASPAFDPARLCVTTDLAAAGDYPGSPGCSLRWLRDEPEDLALEVSAAGRAFVVVADAWFPGWTASVDGRPVALHAVNRMLRGVAVPSGRHRLAMRYVPEGWAAGVTLTRSAFALWLVALGAWLLTRRRGHLPGDRP